MSLEILIKPLKFIEAIRRLGKKKPIAKKLSSKQWAAMPTAIRERAYFTSNVESMKFLNKSKKMLVDYLSGAREMVTTPDGKRVSALKKTSRADFIYKMQKLAKETGLGNILPPGTDISRDLITRMKDIASESRLKLIFDTQTQQAQSYGYYKQGQDPAILDAYPAQRFIRAEQRKVPRPLHKRNRNEVRRKDDMEFWLRMNDQSIGGFGVPFGPWGFNSGMDVEDVRRDEAIRMGLIDKNEQVLPPDDTFNKDLKAAADVEGEFLEKFMDKLGMDAINEGKYVTMAEKISDAPVPAPAKTVSLPVTKELEKAKPAFKLPVPTEEAKNSSKLRNEVYLEGYVVSNAGINEIPRDRVEADNFKKTKIQKLQQKIDTNLKKWTDKTSTFIRVPNKVLPKILEDGRFKSQFESETSEGSYAPDYRATLENNLFSYPKNLDPKKRPIYGYVTTDKTGEPPKKANHDAVVAYGRVRIKLKDNTKDRTTITFADSFSSSASFTPTPLKKPTHESHPFYDKRLVKKALSNHPGYGYAEIQVHDGVALDDISEVFFPKGMEIAEKTKKLLKEKGIKWTVK